MVVAASTAARWLEKWLDSRDAAAGGVVRAGRRLPTAGPGVNGPAQVLSSWGVHSYVEVTMFMIWFTIIGCYALSIAKGDVPSAWLPMISDCLVVQPQSFISRIGLIGGGTLGMGCVLMFSAFLLNAADGAGKRQLVAGEVHFSACCGVFACFCLTCVGAINENELAPAHDLSAVVLFVMFMLYMTFSLHQALQLGIGTRGTIMLRWLIFGAALTDGLIVLALALIFDKTSSDWQIAFCEWTGVFLITYTLQVNVADMGSSIEMAIVGLAQHARTLGGGAAEQERRRKTRLWRLGLL